MGDKTDPFIRSMTEIPMAVKSASQDQKFVNGKKEENLPYSLEIKPSQKNVSSTMPSIYCQTYLIPSAAYNITYSIAVSNKKWSFIC